MKEHHFNTPTSFAEKIRLSNKQLSTNIVVIDIQDIPDEVSENFSLYRNEFYEINLIDKQTQFEFSISGKRYQPKGEPYLCLVAPSQLQSYRVLGEDEAYGYILYFSKRVFNQLKTRGLSMHSFRLQNESYYQLTQNEFEELSFWIELMKQEQGKRAFNYEEILVHILSIFVLKYAAIVQDVKSAFHARPLEIIDHFLSLIASSNEYKNVTQYATEMALTTKQLNDLTKKSLGKTALVVIQEMTMEKAKSLLIQSEVSIKKIAFTLGFQEVSNFSRLFKKQIGSSPSHFRLTHSK